MKLFIVVASISFLVAASAHAPKPWSFKYRSMWNQACTDNVIADSRSAGKNPDPVKVMSFCDCVSDGLQQEYSESEMDHQEDANTPEFQKVMVRVITQCYAGAT